MQILLIDPEKQQETKGKPAALWTQLRHTKIARNRMQTSDMLHDVSCVIICID